MTAASGFVSESCSPLPGAISKGDSLSGTKPLIIFVSRLASSLVLSVRSGRARLLSRAVLTAEYTASNGERFVRAEITDADGKMAWSNIITFEELYR